MSGTNARMPATSALSSTGISTIRPLTRSGARTATSSETLAPSDVPPIDGLLGPEVVEQRDDLLAERRHRVDQRVGRPVRAAVAEQVEGHHVQALRGQRPGQRLLHPARHQQAVQQHDPLVAGAVLGVLEPVAPPSDSTKNCPIRSLTNMDRTCLGRPPPRLAQARLTALMTALSEAVTMLASSPTPHSTLLADGALDVRRRDGVAAGGQRVLG